MEFSRAGRRHARRCLKLRRCGIRCCRVQKCVPNDVTLNAAARLLIVSGSNMSGKSTLLRSIGLNCALAWAGAPVAADRLRVAPLRMGASIRTTDSLQDNRSRFLAEILRIRQIVGLSGRMAPCSSSWMNY